MKRVLIVPPLKYNLAIWMGHKSQDKPFKCWMKHQRLTHNQEMLEKKKIHSQKILTRQTQNFKISPIWVQFIKL